MSMAALADDLNCATRLYNNGVIDFLRYVEPCQMHNYFYEQEMKRREHEGVG